MVSTSPGFGNGTRPPRKPAFWLAAAAALACVGSAQAQVASPAADAGVSSLTDQAKRPALFVEPKPSITSTNYGDGQQYTYKTESRWHAMCGSTPLTPEQLKNISIDHNAKMADHDHILVIDTPREGGSTRASSLNVIFNINTSGMPAGAAAAFTTAEAYIESQFTDPVTITVNVSWANLGSGVIGATGSTYVSAVAYSTSRNALINGMDGDDSIQTFLPTGTTLPVRYNATSATVTNENQVYWTLANYKATVGTGNGTDANMQYNSSFSFDFDPSNGVNSNLLSLVDTVIHEVGHSMGFTSGADFRTNDLEALDLFRFARTDRAGIGNTNPDTTADFQTVAREVDLNNPTNDDVNSDIISAEYRMSDGSPYQASHFYEQSTNPSAAIGIMQPALANGQTFYPNFYKAADRNMLDAIGWDYSTCAAPTITVDPTGVAVCEGDSVNLSVTATGASSYQWKKGTTNIPGATSSTYSIPSVTASDAATYYAVVTNSCTSVTSAGAVVSIPPPPTIFSNPASINRCSGSTATFTVGASNALGFQWLKDAVPVPGANSATFTIPAVTSSDAAVYSCEIAGTCGVVTSIEALLNVIDRITITTQPGGQTVCAGSSVNFSVAATGSSPTYQWQRNGSNLSGETGPTLSLSGVASGDAGDYTCVVGNSCGNVSSDPATLAVNTPPSFTLSPSSQSVCSGSPLTLSVSASGSPAPALQWRKNGSPIGGATGTSYSIPAVNAGSAGSYDCVATNSCSSVPSAAAVLTVTDVPSISLQPNPASVCDGDPFSFSVAATTTVTYQWRRNTVDIGGATGPSYGGTATPGSAGSYDCVLTNACGSTTSNAVLLDVGAAPSISTQPSPVTVGLGAATSLSVVASGSPAVSYQWRKDSSNLSDNAVYSGVLTDTLNIAAVTASEVGLYDVVITNACASTTSNAVLVDLNTSCPADLANGSGQGVPDGGVDINDLLFFLAQFEGGSPAADLDNGTGTGTPDGGVDINDLLYFLGHFEAGC